MSSEDVVLSHNHYDHTGGLLTLRQELMKKNRKALSRAHIGAGAMWPRPDPDGNESNRLLIDRAAFEATGAVYVEHDGPVQMVPGVWLTGPVPRPHPEHNYPGGKLKTRGGVMEDYIPEDQSLVFDTVDGLVLLSGCGHAGIVNTIEYALAMVRKAPIAAAIGGLVPTVHPRRRAARLANATTGGTNEPLPPTFDAAR